MLEGDLAPTFSNLYPEILDPAGLSEHEFRRVISKVNTELVAAFSPYSFRSVMDGILGVATGWLWDDLGFTSVKSRLSKLEAWIENWNADMEKKGASDEASAPPKLISLRRTGYMTVSRLAAIVERDKLLTAILVGYSNPRSRDCSGP
jgi:hypothetical protein